jgi:hypothetical protein
MPCNRVHRLTVLQYVGKNAIPCIQCSYPRASGRMFSRPGGSVKHSWIEELLIAVVFNLFARVPPDVISLRLCTPKVVGV